MKSTRYCKRFYCDEQRERICCSSCRVRRDCANPCLNHPSRCGLENIERRMRNDPREKGAP